MDLEKLFLLVVSRSKNKSFVRPIYGILTGKVSYCLQFRYSLCFVLDLDAESTRTFVSQLQYCSAYRRVNVVASFQSHAVLRE